MRELSKCRDYDKTPWRIPLQIRVRRLGQAIAAGKKIALMLYPREDFSTFRYRCYNVQQATEKSTQWYTTFFFQTELDTVRMYLRQIKLLILVRYKWTLTMEELVMEAKRQDVKILFDEDDRAFDIDGLKILANTIGVPLDDDDSCDEWFSYITRLQKTAELAEGFLTIHPFLGEEMKKRFGFDYQVIPNSLNEEQLATCEKLVRQKKKKANQKPFTMGYFSGSPTHKNDFAICRREIFSFLEKYPDTKLQIVGRMELPEEAEPFLQSGRIELLPLTDFIDLERLMAQVDVNLVPLVDNVFTNCKSELKFFEAAVVETPTLATPIYPYAHCIRNGENGFLCREGQWFSCLENIYQDKVDIAAVCKAAKEDALKHYSGTGFLQAIENAYNYFAE